MRTRSVFVLLPVRFSRGFLFNPRLQRTAIGCHHGGAAKSFHIMSSNNESTGYYLLKSEPCEFSINDLENSGEEVWDGVRNFQARNILRTMKVGDKGFFYHSSCPQPGIVGTLFVSGEAEPDVTAYQDSKHKGYDPKSTAENCRWDAVRVRLDTIYPVTLTLKELKAQAKHNEMLQQMTLFRNSRLSVHRLTLEEWQAVEDLVDRKVAGEDLLDVP